MHRFFTYVFVVFFVTAGSYHFINPDFYIGLIPDYFPYPYVINGISGFLEISLGVLLLFQKFKKLAAAGIILLLVVFISSHIHFIQIGSCVPDSLCVSPWLSWIRLLVVHPLLVLWVWYIGFSKTTIK